MLIHGHLLDDPERVPRPGWLRVEGPCIVERGDGPPPAAPDLGHDRAVVCPGFVDAHLHLPQIDAIGHDGLELLDWLEQVVFPAESRWADLEVARDQAAAAYARLLGAGTLGFAAFLSPHGTTSLRATIAAAQRLPLRGVAGPALMDRGGPPDLLGHEPGRLANSERGRFAASVNPRFAVSCSDALLGDAGRRAAAAGVLVQTHLAETGRECAEVARLFPDDRSYAHVYDRHGLLGPRTLLAHALHLDDEQWRLIAERGATVVHCPTANAFLGAGVFDLAAARRHGVRVALGSDVAAGPDLAMPRVARAMIDTAKIRRAAIDPGAVVPTAVEAWAIITRVNAEALGFEDAGRLDPGAAADLLVLETPLAIDAELVARLLYTWDDGYIAERVVDGERRNIETSPRRNVERTEAGDA